MKLTRVPHTYRYQTECGRIHLWTSPNERGFWNVEFVKCKVKLRIPAFTAEDALRGAATYLTALIIECETTLTEVTKSE